MTEQPEQPKDYSQFTDEDEFNYYEFKWIFILSAVTWAGLILVGFWIYNG
ncbi:MAG: hypothetical protein KZQ94_16125 [Candidatus Thiodiazotropha sp. (ex Troendleina suluensis)]|nr:hypothetical protein [Candidatus Thiodiazotropha sp. (ex Troendleina suluensis)]